MRLDLSLLCQGALLWPECRRFVFETMCRADRDIFVMKCVGV